MLYESGPGEMCLAKHLKDDTLEYHECMCQFDYSSIYQNKIKALKMRHCLEVAEIHKMNNFYLYIGVAVVVGFLVLGIICVFCYCKWYIEMNTNPCTCCSSLLNCRKRCKKKTRRKPDDPVNVFDQNESGHSWSPVNLPPVRDVDIKASPSKSRKRSCLCMNFCLSDPVQDCCEFFDCDIMWRKKSIYTIPIFGRKKQQYFHRRPTRPAPPPPKAVVLPQVKCPEPVIDDMECEPVPEAPPSPEPVRVLPPKSMYVDPLAFLQMPFLKSVPKEIEVDDKNDKDDAIYTKFKNMVLSKVKKSASLASISKIGVVSNDPNGIQYEPDGLRNKKYKTGSLASLNNIGESELDGSYGSTRSLSLASLQMLEQEHLERCGGIVNDPRSRISVISSATADDIPPHARKDEYIDLEEMSRRMEAKLLAARAANQMPKYVQEKRSISPMENATSTLPKTYTPNFIPASAFPKALSSFDPNAAPSPQYYPPVPASQGKPAVPARTSVGSPIYPMSPTGTLGRAKPVIPPRPPNMNVGRCSPKSRNASPYSSKSHSLPHSPRLLVKPSVPPPPPPSSCKGPIESAI